MILLGAVDEFSGDPFGEEPDLLLLRKIKHISQILAFYLIIAKWTNNNWWWEIITAVYTMYCSRHTLINSAFLLTKSPFRAHSNTTRLSKNIQHGLRESNSWAKSSQRARGIFSSMCTNKKELQAGHHKIESPNSCADTQFVAKWNTNCAVWQTLLTYIQVWSRSNWKHYLFISHKKSSKEKKKTVVLVLAKQEQFSQNAAFTWVARQCILISLTYLVFELSVSFSLSLLSFSRTSSWPCVCDWLSNIASRMPVYEG